MTKMLTNQEVFDKAAAHLLTQRKQALLCPGSINASCVYRSPDGLKCALGIFIPDDAYRSDMENNGALTLFENWPSMMSNAGLSKDPHLDLLDALQSVHDHYDPWEWATQLRHVAKHHGLDASIVDKFPPIEGPG